MLQTVLVSLVAQSRNSEVDPVALARRLRLSTSRAVVMGGLIHGGPSRYQLTAWSHQLPPLEGDEPDIAGAVVELFLKLVKRRKQLRKLQRRWDFVLVCTASPSGATQAGIILDADTCWGLGALGLSLAVKVVPDPELSHDNPGVSVATLHRAHLAAPFFGAAST